ncbi:ankyrin, partial [Glonium stellatum]
HESTVRILLNRNAGISACSSLGDALQAAALNGHVSIVKLLLQRGANVNDHGGFRCTALTVAAYRGHKEVVEILLDAGA